MTASPGPGGGATRHCQSCGSALAPGAVYCRECGAKYEAPAAAPASVAPGPAEGGASGRSRTALWIGAVIVLIGAGAAVAILLSRGGDSSRTTVLVDRAGRTTTVTTAADNPSTEAGASDPEALASPTVEAGQYVQAGSFRTLSHAEEERERLAAAGVEVSVISSDGAAELYPGFQVLFGGPFTSKAQEHSMITALGDNGVPSAFARDLSPASLLGGASDAAGRWTGELERLSSERPNLNGPVPVTVEIEPDGNAGTLEAEGECSESLALKRAGGTTLTYSQDAPCVAAGDVFIRPTGGELMVTMLPLATDIFVTGSLSSE